MAERIGLHSVRLIGKLQERAARAVPAAVQEYRHGRWLRYNDSKTTWWAGTALMRDREQAAALAPRIAVAEDFYAAHHAPTRFQVCPACPPDLDEALARRRYQRGGVMSLEVATTANVVRRLLAPSLRVDLTTEPDAEWFGLLMATQGHDADPAPEWRLLQRVARPSAYATAFISGRPVAVGRAVADAGWAGVFSMATLPDARRQGATSAVLATLCTTAVRLYRRAGFDQACAYHYRTAVTWTTAGS